MTLADALSGNWAGFAAEEAVPLLQAEVARLQFAYDTLTDNFKRYAEEHSR